MWSKVCIFLTVLYLARSVTCDSAKNDSGVLRIKLVRQKTPFEQHLNAPNLKQYGLNFDWLYKKHHYHENRTNDSIALYRYIDNEFYGKIVIGHPGQTLNVAFDTAWTVSWVLSSRCSSYSHMGCLFHNKYDHDKSSEYRKDGRPYIAADGKFNLTGIFSYDNISIAHSNVTNQSFVEMDSVPYTYIFSKIDGVLGLGLQHDSYEPFFYTLYRQNKIKNNIFSIYLNRDKQSNHGGNVILGFVDLKHIHSKRDKQNRTIYDTPTFLPVEPGKYWQFHMDRINVTYKEPLIVCNDGCTAITDTSSNNILGPKTDIAKIHDIIKAQPFYLGRYTVKCDTVNKLPRIIFTLGGQNFTLKGTDYTIKMSYLSVTICLSAFVPHDYTDFWVLGGAFLSEYYSIYNIEEKQIGFVKAAP